MTRGNQEHRRQRYDATVGDLFTCTICHQEKLGSEFYFDKTKKSGRRLRCKACELERLKNVRARRAAAGLSNTRPGQRERKNRLKNAHDFACNAVRSMVKAGILSKPGHCTRCGLVCNPEAHHPNGWDTVEKLIDIEWVCRACHREIHRDDAVRWGYMGIGVAMPPPGGWRR